MWDTGLCVTLSKPHVGGNLCALCVCGCGGACAAENPRPWSLRGQLCLRFNSLAG